MELIETALLWWLTLHYLKGLRINILNSPSEELGFFYFYRREARCQTVSLVIDLSCTRGPVLLRSIGAVT